MAGAKTNWFVIWVSAAVVGVLVIAGVLVVWMNNAGGSGPVPESSIIDTETGAIAIGEGEDTVGTYIDFMCPICNQFEQIYGDTLQSLVDDGMITLEIHPVAILDRASQGTKFSTRAASAMYCVAENDPDAALDFMTSMYANQPEENTAGLTDEAITAIAEAAGATNSAECIADQRYDGFVTAMTKLIPPDESGQVGTPTVTVNGERITLTGDPQVDIVDRLS
jgi:protein-disulfide isomerase